MHRPLVALDNDQVMFPFMEAVIDHYNERHDTGLTLGDYAAATLEEVWGMNTLDAERTIQEFLNQDLCHIEPIMHAVQSIERLRPFFRLAVVTARVTRVEQATNQWLLHHFPDAFEYVVVCGNRFSGEDYRLKSDVCLEIGAEALVDDHASNVLDCAGAGLYCVLFGKQRHTLDELKLLPNVAQAQDWPETVQTLMRWREQITA